MKRALWMRSQAAIAAEPFAEYLAAKKAAATNAELWQASFKSPALSPEDETDSPHLIAI